MANAVFPATKEGWLSATGPDMDTDDIRCSLLDAYTYDSTDATGADISAGTWIQMSPTLGTKTVTGGVFDAADTTFTSVAAGAATEALILHTLEAADLTAVTTTTATDVLTKTAHGLVADDRVVVSNQATTTSLSEVVIYYVLYTDANNFQLSLTSAGAAVDIDATGTCDIHLMDSCVLIAHLDTGTGFPVTPNGSDITVTWDAGASKIFAL